jgi:two-component system response regulator DegU
MTRTTSAAELKLGAGYQITVVVADDHPVVRKGIIDEIQENERIQVVAEAKDGDEAIEAVRCWSPDVLLLDINMPGAKPAQIMRRVKDLKSGPRVLVLSAYGDLEYVLAMLSAGAIGYMLKDEEPGRICEGILAVSEGKTWLSPDVAASLVQHSIREGPLAKGDELSQREREILVLLAKGHANEEIAETLFIAEGTVKNHVSRIYDKIDVSSRAEAVAWAWEHGIVS